ncbi:MAG: Crp/Fnr family transcriptional regulator [Bacillota bacterium]
MKDCLKNNKFFSELNQNELKQLEDIIYTSDYKKDEIIFFEGEPGEGLFIVESGKVKLLKMTESGREHILHILKKGDIFSEVVLFDRGEYPATAIALEKSTIGIIKREKIEKLIEENSIIGIKLLRVMGKRLRRAQEKIRNLSLKNTAGRLAGIILFLVEEHGIRQEDSIKIELSITQEDLSNMIGASRETVSRILSRFEKKGLISTSRQQIIVKNIDKLNEKV